MASRWHGKEGLKVRKMERPPRNNYARVFTTERRKSARWSNLGQMVNVGDQPVFQAYLIIVRSFEMKCANQCTHRCLLSWQNPYPPDLFAIVLFREWGKHGISCWSWRKLSILHRSSGGTVAYLSTVVLLAHGRRLAPIERRVRKIQFQLNVSCFQELSRLLPLPFWSRHSNSEINPERM